MNPYDQKQMEEEALNGNVWAMQDLESIYRGMGDVRADTLLAMQKFPTLTSDGIGVFERSYVNAPPTNLPQLKVGRQRLLKHSNSIVAIREWIRGNIRPIKNINWSAQSYPIKGLAERALGYYISSGELIAASILEGYECELCGGLHVAMNMSKRSLNILFKKDRAVRGF